PRPPQPSLFPYTTLFRSLLGRGAQQGGQQVHLGDPVLFDHAFDTAAVQRVNHHEGPRLLDLRLLDVGGDDMVLSETFTQTLNELDRKSTRLNSSHVKISY